jgi:ATP-dependent Clp protease protease subunit
MNKKIYIFGSISPWDYSEKTLTNELDKIADGEDITVYINSPGGSVFTGYAIYNLLLEKMQTNNITIKIIGLAASIASIIAQAGHKTLIAKTASFLIHNPYSLAIGDAEEFKKQGKTLDEITNQLVDVYKNKSNLSDEDLKKIMSEDRIMTSKDAKKYKLVDAIFEPDKDENKDIANIKLSDDYFSLVAKLDINPIIENNNLINNNGGDMPEPQTDISKLYQDKVTEVSELQILINKKDVELANKVQEISDLNVNHDKVLNAKNLEIENLKKENQDFKNVVTKAEVTAQVEKLVNEGKVMPAMKEFEIEDLFDKKLNNESAYNKKLELLNAIKPIDILNSSFDRQNSEKTSYTIDEAMAKENQEAVNALIEKIMAKDKISYEAAFDKITGGN